MGRGVFGRRRNPRLAGTLHILDITGREVAVPLRGRATVLTAGGTGLTGYGEVWAVHTAAATADTSLMISYGRDGSAGDRASGLCAAGETVILGGLAFTWRHPPAMITAPAMPAALTMPAIPAAAMPTTPAAVPAAPAAATPAAAVPAAPAAI
ncbi:hypothetical protein AB0F72_06140 [Actinoplanes sp. NPDC023936]|uniref:hypothetical protein n=1 Tax=Actinoplanes sp. NPDC023936 TaxID=3154910 RepID=UPI0033E8C68D